MAEYAQRRETASPSPVGRFLHGPERDKIGDSRAVKAACVSAPLKAFTSEQQDIFALIPGYFHPDLITIRLQPDDYLFTACMVK